MMSLTMSKRRSAGALVLALSAVFAGCSGGSSRFNGGPGGPVVPNGAPSALQVNAVGFLDQTTNAFSSPVVDANNPTSPVQFKGNIVYEYVLADSSSDVLSLSVQFSQDGGQTFAAATLIGQSSPGVLTGLEAKDYTNTALPSRFTWDAITDLGGNLTAILDSTITIRISPNDGAESGPLIVDTGARLVLDPPKNIGPSISNFSVTGTGDLQGLIGFDFTLSDPEGDPLSVFVDFQRIPAAPPPPAAAPPPSAPQPVLISSNTITAQTDIANGTFAVPASVAGAAQAGSLVWNSLTQLPRTSFEDTQVRVTVTDTKSGISVSKAIIIKVGNPTAAFVQNSRVVGRQGNIKLSFEAFDSDEDAVTATLEFSADGGLSFSPMSLAATNAGAISGNKITGLPTLAGGKGINVTWNSLSDLPANVRSGIIRITLEDNDVAAQLPTALPDIAEVVGDPPLPGLILNTGGGAFKANSISFVTSSFPLVGSPVIVGVSAGTADRLYAPSFQLGSAFIIDGENFGTDESLIQIRVNDILQVVVEADSNFILARSTVNAVTGLLSVTVNGVKSNDVPILVRGSDYWEDGTPNSDSDVVELPDVLDPSTSGQLADLDGDGDLDLVVGQDGPNSILINQNLNQSIRALATPPFNFGTTTNEFVVHVVKSAISRNRGSYNANATDMVTVTAVKSSADTALQAAPTTVLSSVTSRVNPGAGFAQRSVGAVAGTMNTAARAGSVGSGPSFDVSVLNRSHLEIFPRTPSDQLSVSENNTRRPLGFKTSYRQSFGATGTDRIVLTGVAGVFATGDVLTATRGGTALTATTTVIAAVNLGGNSFQLDVLAERGLQAADVVANTGSAATGTIGSVARSPATRLGGTTLVVAFPAAGRTTQQVADALNNAAILKGLDVPGQTLNILVASTAGLNPGLAVMNRALEGATVLSVEPETLGVRLRTTGTFRVGDAINNAAGTQVAVVTRLLPTRNDFLARQVPGGVGFELVSDDVIVVGNGTANQTLGFRSNRLISLQTSDQNGNWTFSNQFKDLTIAIGDGLGPDKSEITVDLFGTFTTDQLVAKLNLVGLAGKLAGNPQGKVFEASRVGTTAPFRIEIRVASFVENVAVRDLGAGRILSFGGRFIKPNARGLGNYVDESANRLNVTRADFTHDIVVADLNEDGAPDIISANALAQNELLFNDGIGHFLDGNAQLPQVLDESFGVAAGDLDNDGDLDLVFANRARNRVLENQSVDPTSVATGNFRERSFDAFPAAEPSDAGKLDTGVDIGDFNADGLNDIVFANLPTGAGSGRDGSLAIATGAVLFQGQLIGGSADFANSTPQTPRFGFANSFLRQARPSSGTSAFDVRFGDVNADGLIDLVVAAADGGLTSKEATNTCYVQSRNNVAYKPDNGNPAAPSPAVFQKGGMVFVATNAAVSATIIEVLPPAVAGGDFTLVLSASAAGFPAAAKITGDATPVQDGLIIEGRADSVGRTIFKVAPNDSEVDPTVVQPAPPAAQIRRDAAASLNIGDIVKLFDLTGQEVNTGFLTIVDKIEFRDTIGSLISIDLVVDKDVTALTQGGFSLREFPPLGDVTNNTLVVIGERTQAAPFKTPVKPSGRGFSLLDFFAVAGANNEISRKAADFSKKVSLGDDGGVNRTRTPRSALVFAKDAGGLGGGATTFDRLILIGNGQDRGIVTFPNSNLLFITADAFGSKRIGIGDYTLGQVQRAFQTSPFIDNETFKLHMPIDSSETVGSDIGDIDNDGDLDLFFFNGGGTNAQQNKVFISKFSPLTVDAVPFTYP